MLVASTLINSRKLHSKGEDRVHIPAFRASKTEAEPVLIVYVALSPISESWLSSATHGRCSGAQTIGPCLNAAQSRINHLLGIHFGEAPCVSGANWRPFQLFPFCLGLASLRSRSPKRGSKSASRSTDGWRQCPQHATKEATAAARPASSSLKISSLRRSGQTPRRYPARASLGLLSASPETVPSLRYARRRRRRLLRLRLVGTRV